MSVFERFIMKIVQIGPHRYKTCASLRYENFYMLKMRTDKREAGLPGGHPFRFGRNGAQMEIPVRILGRCASGGARLAPTEAKREERLQLI